MLPAPYLPPIETRGQTTTQPQAQQVRNIDGVCKVTFDDSEYDAESGDLVFKGHITATYGPTTITCDVLRLNAQTKTGIAETGVVLVDPEGTLRASRLDFDWDKKTGKAKGVVLQADNVFLTAETTEVFPDHWELTNAEGALSGTGNAPVKFTAGSVTISPGRSGVARHVYMKVMGMKLGPIPRLSFMLRKRVKGFGLPSITNRKGKGLGVAWDGGIAMGDHAVASAFWETFPRREPGFGLQYGYSPLDPETASFIAPQTELDERYSDGWFDNVSIRTPDEEQDYMRTRRQTFAAGTFWNQGTTGRPVDSENVSKKFDFVVESGGPWNGLGTLGTVRVQSVREDNHKPFVNRVLAEGTLLAPPVRLGSKLDGHLRLDLFGSASENGTFAWGRFEAGLVYRPSNSFALGLSYGNGSATGTPDFSFDGLVATRSLSARADWQFGPYTVRYLAKYDLGRSVWYDKEYELALVARQFEPYIVYRQFPSETRIGVRFRIDNLRDRLTRRSQHR